MPTSELTCFSPSPLGGRMDAPLVLRALQEFCEAQQPGTFVPTQTELMRHFKASERAVRWALDELQRQGKITTRRGARSCVAEFPSLQSNGYTPTATSNGSEMAVDGRTVVAITQPDSATFDQAIRQLYAQTELADLSLACRLFSPKNNVVPSGEKPLGYILFRDQLLPLAQQLQSAGQRVVLVGMPPIGVMPQVPNVMGNHEQGGYLQTRHLLDLGHRRIAFYGDAELKTKSRFAGHQRAILEARKRGVPVIDSLITNEDYTAWKHNHTLAEAFFAQPDAPTGIIAWNDHEAARLLSFLNYIRVRVPQQVSLVGYDNLPEGEKVHPALTTVDSALEAQLQAALQILMAPTPPTPHQSVVVLPTLIRRDSTAAPVF